MTNENFGFLAPALEADDATKIINKRLIDLGLSIQELADERGIDRAVLSQLINGHRPHYEHRNWLCLRLSLSKDRLWGNPTTRRSYALRRLSETSPKSPGQPHHTPQLCPTQANAEGRMSKDKASKPRCSTCRDKKHVVIQAGYAMGQWWDEMTIACPHCVQSPREYVLACINSQGRAA